MPRKQRGKVTSAPLDGKCLREQGWRILQSEDQGVLAARKRSLTSKDGALAGDGCSVEAKASFLRCAQRTFQETRLSLGVYFESYTSADCSLFAHCPRLASNSVPVTHCPCCPTPVSSRPIRRPLLSLHPQLGLRLLCNVGPLLTHYSTPARCSAPAIHGPHCSTSVRCLLFYVSQRYPDFPETYAKGQAPNYLVEGNSGCCWVV